MNISLVFHIGSPRGRLNTSAASLLKWENIRDEFGKATDRWAGALRTEPHTALGR